MRFRKLDLIAYGKFTDYKIVFDDDANFHLIYGDNEKGKSTITTASADLLYGITHNTNYSFKHKNSKLRIGAELQHSDGERLYFKRKKGKKDTITDAQDQSIKDSCMDKYVNQIDRNTYCNLFGLSYESLVQGGEDLVKNCKNIGSSLVQATSGINNIDEIRKNFENNQQELFKKTGKKFKIRELVDEHKEIKAKKDEATLHTSKWKKIEEDFKNKKDEVDKLNSAMGEIEKDLTKLNRIKVTLPVIVNLNQEEKLLQEYKYIPLIPKDTIKTRKEHTEKIKNINRELTVIESANKDIKQEIGQINLNEEILNYENEIEDLYKKVEVYKSKQEKITDITFELKSLYEEKKRHLVSMGIKEYDDNCLEDLRIDEISKEQIRILADDHVELTNMAEGLRKTLIKLEEELKDLERQEQELGEIQEISDLEIIIQRAQKELHLVENIEELKIKLRNLAQKNINSLKSLMLWEGTKEEIFNLKLPLIATLLDYRDRLKDLQDNIDKNNERLQEKKENLQSENRKLENFDTLVNIITEEHLFNLRTNRNRIWNTIYESVYPVIYQESNTMLLETIKSIKNPMKEFPEYLKESDNAADNVIKDQEKLTERKIINQCIENLQDEINYIELELNALNEKESIILEDWKNEWIQTDLVKILLPEEMLEWIENIQKLKDSFTEEEELNDKISKFEARVENQKEKLIKEFMKSNLIPTDDHLENLIIKSNQLLNKLKDQNIKLQNLRIEKSKKETSKSIEQSSRDEVENQLEEWNAKWNNLMLSIGKDKEFTCREAKKYIEMIEKLFTYIDNYNKQYVILENEKKYVQEFETNISNLVKNIKNWKSLKEGPLIIEDLNKQLVKERENKTTRDFKLQELLKNEKNQSLLKSNLKHEEKCQESILKRYNCANVDDIEAVENKSLIREEIEEKIRKLKDEVTRLGDGKCIVELIIESKRYDIDEIDVEIEKVQLLKQRNQDESKKLFKDYGVIEKEYDEIINGNSTIAAEAAQQQSEIFTSIVEKSTEYFKNMLASKLLTKSVEKYRQDNEYQIIKKAADVFNQITENSFRGIEIQYDEDSIPFIAGIRNDTEGTTVTLEGMSKGTADQLYLALRIAGIEKYIKDWEAMPLIFDDIVINFDDNRSKKILEVLSNLSKNVQVIYLTHHNRIVEIAEQVIKDQKVQIHNLS